MASVFEFLDRLGPAGVVIQAIAITIIGIAGLLTFILARRAWRSRLYRRRDARAVQIRAQWDAIVDGLVPADEWRRDPMSAEIVETLLLDSLEEAGSTEAERLLRALRHSGLLDARIHAARTCRGWRRRQALTSLGRTRADEAIAPLAEALHDRSQATVITAVRALGRIGCRGAAVPLLDFLATHRERLPTLPVQNAVIGACRSQPEVITPYLDRASPDVRRLLVRALSEIARGDMTEVLMRLTTDPEAEVRASSARLLTLAPVDVSLPSLTRLAADDEWFVRLRAIVALGQLQHPAAVAPLVKGLCDRHRFVRLRAARGLATMEEHLATVLDQVEATRDRYALQALLSELELSGVVMRHVERLTSITARWHAERLIVRLVNLGARRLIVSALTEHGNPAVREALARLVMTCHPGPLVPLVDRAIRQQQQSAPSRRLLERVRAALAEARRATRDERTLPVRASR